MDISLSQICKAVNGKLSGNKDKVIKGASSFEAAGPDEITFAGDVRYLEKLHETKAGAILVPVDATNVKTDHVKVQNPRLAYVTVMDMFNPEKQIIDDTHPSVIFGDDFQKGSPVTIGANVTIGDSVRIGNHCLIKAGVYIGNNVTIGDNVLIHPNVTILDGSVIGNRVVINSGSVIGSDGYGFTPDGKKYVKIPHTGIVRIGDDVEIGACNTIDRATAGETRIENGVKTDNLVHIAHNVVVGENTLLVAQVGIAGSTKVGSQAILAGKVGVAGHLTIGDNTIIGPAAGILKSVPDNEVVSGTPAMPHKLWLRVQNILARLPELKKTLKSLEKRVSQIENDRK